MTLDEIQREIDRISWGARYAKVKDGLGREHYVVIRSLSLADRNWIGFIHEQALKEGAEMGLLKESDLLSAYIESGIWTEEQEGKISKLRSDIEKLELGLKKETEAIGVRKIEGLLRGAKRAFQKLHQERFEKFSASAERYAEDRRIHAMVWCCIHKMDGTRFWPTWESFENEVDSVMVSNALAAVLSQQPASQTQIRKLARSPLWRYKWNGSKNCDDLFGKAIVELDSEQEAIVYWSQVYDAAYEAYERPSDDVIDDDDALDEWFEEQAKKRKEEQGKKANEKKQANLFSERVGKHGEIFVVANKNNNPDAPDAEEIWDLNPESNKKFIRGQMDTIKNAGTVDEKTLRPDYKARMMSGGKRADYEIRRGKKQVNRLQDY
jgi:hypothetical protein